jgi:WGR domain
MIFTTDKVFAETLSVANCVVFESLLISSRFARVLNRLATCYVGCGLAANSAALFGEWSVVREWGRIGHSGTVRIEAHATRGKADLALILKWAEKQRRGYR